MQSCILAHRCTLTHALAWFRVLTLSASNMHSWQNWPTLTIAIRWADFGWDLRAATGKPSCALERLQTSRTKRTSEACVGLYCFKAAGKQDSELCAAWSQSTRLVLTVTALTRRYRISC